MLGWRRESSEAGAGVTSARTVLGRRSPAAPRVAVSVRGESRERTGPFHRAGFAGCGQQGPGRLHSRGFADQVSQVPATRAALIQPAAVDRVGPRRLTSAFDRMLAAAQQGVDEGHYGELSQIDQAARNVDAMIADRYLSHLAPRTNWINFNNLGTRRDVWPRRRRSGALRRR